jgi:hypothetical protein
MEGKRRLINRLLLNLEREKRTDELIRRRISIMMVVVFGSASFSCFLFCATGSSDQSIDRSIGG